MEDMYLSSIKADSNWAALEEFPGLYLPIFLRPCWQRKGRSTNVVSVQADQCTTLL